MDAQDGCARDVAATLISYFEVLKQDRAELPALPVDVLLEP
jgi:hypothetical protein